MDRLSRMLAAAQGMGGGGGGAPAQVLLYNMPKRDREPTEDEAVDSPVDREEEDGEVVEEPGDNNEDTGTGAGQPANHTEWTPEEQAEALQQYRRRCEVAERLEDALRDGHPAILNSDEALLLEEARNDAFITEQAELLQNTNRNDNAYEIREALAESRDNIRAAFTALQEVHAPNAPFYCLPRSADDNQPDAPGAGPRPFRGVSTAEQSLQAPGVQPDARRSSLPPATNPQPHDETQAELDHMRTRISAAFDRLSAAQDQATPNNRLRLDLDAVLEDAFDGTGWDFESPTHRPDENSSAEDALADMEHPTGPGPANDGIQDALNDLQSRITAASNRLQQAVRDQTNNPFPPLRRRPGRFDVDPLPDVPFDPPPTLYGRRNAMLDDGAPPHGRNRRNTDPYPGLHRRRRVAPTPVLNRPPVFRPRVHHILNRKTTVGPSQP
ncbi:hypothetical protein LTR17_020845 [Elasticomyces elasticus]|nr:hypothetical protein LTR17_020845 [Elasticomyces elasticus]